MRSIIHRSRVRGGRRVLSARGLALTAGVAVAMVPGLMLAASSAQAAPHATASHTVLPHVKHHQSSDSGPNAHHDTSLPLRVMATRVPHVKRHNHVAPDNQPLLPQPPASHLPDPVVQAHMGTAPAVATTNNFDGISDTSTGNPCGCAPPDTNAAVGTTQVVEIVNTAFAVYSKTGATIMAPTASNTLWSGFGGNCQTNNDGDATVAFDKLANRWVIQQFANVGSASGPYFECVAVSTSADATGTYNRYSFQFSTFPDYPKLSVWPDAYYTTYNMFTAGGSSFVDAEICAMNRANMLTGAAATQQCFTTDSSHGGILAADVDGTTPPPSGEPETVMGIGTTSTTLAYWHFHVDFTTPANSTFTGPTNLTVASYSTACGGGTCIPQSGTTQQLDSLGDRIMYRLAYRNFGDHESLVNAQSVTSGSSTGIRWYEFRISGGNPTVFQQGTYAPDATFRWMPSIAMDHSGDIALGYSASSSSIHPSIRFTGRAPGDALGTMTQAETTVFTGGGSQTGSLSRWGDYSSMQVDPSDDCTFWYANEYIPANGSFNWNTRLASFQLPGCTTGNTVTVTNPGNQTGTVGTAASLQMSATDSQSGQTFTWSATGLPAGLSINSSSGLISGTPTTASTNSVTVTATDTTGAHGSASFTWTINSAGGNTVTVTNPGNQTGTVGTAASLQMSATDSQSGQTFTWSATGLPAGLSINSSSGLISGTPTTASTNSVTVTATDTTGAHGSASFTWTINASSGCSGAGTQLLGNPGFETGSAAPWTSTAGVINPNGAGETSHSGTWYAWLDGYGTTHTDTLKQSITIPAGCTNTTFSFWLHIDTAETTTTTAFDTLKVQVLNSSGTVLSTLATFSNLNHITGYLQHTYSIGSFAGSTITLKFTGTEDVSLQTSFVVDDTAATTG